METDSCRRSVGLGRVQYAGTHGRTGTAINVQKTPPKDHATTGLVAVAQ